MLKRLRQIVSSESGFTLVEILVVILIIGILAAIAIPAFLSQTSKASDAAAKTQVGTLEVAEKSYAIEHNGSFAGGTLAELQKIEPTLKDTSTATAAVVKSELDVFEVQSTAKGSGNVYKIKVEKGAVARSCTTSAAGNTGGGCSGGSW
jgi:type IV pilus assembly protein PilA